MEQGYFIRISEENPEKTSALEELLRGIGTGIRYYEPINTFYAVIEDESQIERLVSEGYFVEKANTFTANDSVSGYSQPQQ